MKKPSIIAIQRAERFSPNSVGKDRAILEAVAAELARRWDTGEVPVVDEEAWTARPSAADVILTMARTPEALQQQATMEKAGSLVVNTPEGVDNCQRSLLQQLMQRNEIPHAPETGSHGYWLKRGDAAAQSKQDVVFCSDEAALSRAKEQFRQRGISQWVVSAHVVGDLVKFYGVAGEMFRTFYPTDDGISKFGDEALNGQAHHYSYSLTDLRIQSEKLARLTGVTFYGGDAIVQSDGQFCIIDFNDWPSFSRCREEAAQAGARAVERLMAQR